jgi:hypothetical protein
MKHLSWPGVIVVAGSTILSWLNTSPVVPPVAHPREAIESGTTANSAAPMAASIAAMHLHDWSPPAPARVRAERDIFAFKQRPARPVAPPAPPASSRGLLEAGDGAQPQLVPFKMIGFAEDTGPDGAVRTAIISGQGQLYLVKEGETVGSIYQVGTILPDGVELLDNTGGPSLRLALK